MTVPTPPDDGVRLLLQTVWDQLAVGEHWPKFGVVDRHLYRQHQLDINGLIGRTPHSLLVGGRQNGGAAPSTTEQLRLTIAGVVACTGTGVVADTFLAAVREATRVEAECEAELDEVSFTADRVIPGASDGVSQAETEAARALARQVGLLLLAEPWAASSSLYEGGWRLGMNRLVREYKDVDTIDAYWRIRSAQLSPSPVAAEGSAAVRGPLWSTAMSSSGVLQPPIFVVHGRDDARKYQALRVLEHATDRKVVVLHEQANRGATLLEKLENHLQAAAFAVVLLTADDEGRLRDDALPLQPRGRQNVVLELGMFIAHLGRENVAVLLDPAIEPPSDIGGLAYIALDDADAWKWDLLREVEASGIAVDWSRVP